MVLHGVGKGGGLWPTKQFSDGLCNFYAINRPFLY